MDGARWQLALLCTVQRLPGDVSAHPNVPRGGYDALTAKVSSREFYLVELDIRHPFILQNTILE